MHRRLLGQKFIFFSQNGMEAPKIQVLSERALHSAESCGWLQNCFLNKWIIRGQGCPFLYLVLLVIPLTCMHLRGQCTSPILAATPYPGDLSSWTICPPQFTPSHLAIPSSLAVHLGLIGGHRILWGSWNAFRKPQPLYAIAGGPWFLNGTWNIDQFLYLDPQMFLFSPEFARKGGKSWAQAQKLNHSQFSHLPSFPQRGFLFHIPQEEQDKSEASGEGIYSWKSWI